MREGDNRDIDDDYDDSTASYPWIPWEWGRWRRRYGENEVSEEAPSEESTSGEEDDSWLDEGLISLLLVSGVILFLFPEPLTSTIGIILVLIGALAWLVDALL